MQTPDNMGSIVFIFAYLVIIWVFLLKLIISNIRAKTFKQRDAIWKWTFLAYFLLGAGDLFHLGLRILVYFSGIGYDNPTTDIAIGSGYIISGLSMTYFYIAIFHAWGKLYGKQYSTLNRIKQLFAILYIAFILRLVLMFLPYNHWFEGDGTVDFGFDFRWITAIPIYIIGVITVALLFKTSSKEKQNPTGIDADMNRGNFNAAIWYLVSYITYSITLFFVAILPLTGLFMIPKTIAYLVAFYYHYKTMLNKS